MGLSRSPNNAWNEYGTGDNYRLEAYISRIEATIKKWPPPRKVVLML